MIALETAFLTAALAFIAKIYFDFRTEYREQRNIAASLAGEMSAYVELLDAPRLVDNLRLIALIEYDLRQKALCMFFSPPVTNPVFDKVADHIGLLSSELATEISRFYNVVAGFRLIIGTFSSDRFLELPDEMQTTALRQAADDIGKHLLPANKLIERLHLISQENFKNYTSLALQDSRFLSMFVNASSALQRLLRQILVKVGKK